MKRITALFLSIALLFSIEIITSCSGDSNKSSVKESTASKTEVVTEAEFNSEKALEFSIKYLDAENSKYSDSDIEEKMNYKMLPSTDGNIYFMRYKLDKIKDDLLIFKSGRVLSLNSDKDEFKKNKDNFSVDIIGIKDEEILKQPDCVSGGFGAEFDV